MASGITAAGSASGMDFESIIMASVMAKEAQLNKQTTVKKEEANIQLSGVGNLRSALETFQDSIQALTEDNGFNERKVVTDQGENPYFSVSTKSDAANGNYDIAVEQIASTEKISQTFDKDTRFGAGTLTFTLPPIESDDPTVSQEERTVSIDIEEGATLEQIRKEINQNDLGITASIIKTENGDKLVIDSGLSGDKNDGKFKMSFTSTSTADPELGYVNGEDFFNYDSSQATDGKHNNWNKSKPTDAIINVDGEQIRSSTNSFDNQISGLSIEVHRVSDFTLEDPSDPNSTRTYKTNNVRVEQDFDAVATKMQTFVDAFNTLQTALDDLGKNNTYTEGKNNYDGGELAGDSMLRGLQNQLDAIMTSMSNVGNVDIYSLGLDVDKDGVWSLDSEKFKEGLTNNFNGVVNAFTGEDGLLVQLDNAIEEYVKSDGVLDLREEELNETIRRYEDKERKNALYLEEYEAHLRQKYAKLDITIAGYNQSLMYLQSALI